MRLVAVSALTVAVPLAVAAAPAPQPGQTPSPSDAGRYTILPAKGGAFVRLDRRSGATSLCQVVDGDLDCRLSADQRTAMQAEIDRLAREVDRLKARLGEGGDTAAGRDQGDAQFQKWAQRELDRMGALAKDMMQRLAAILRALNQGSAAPRNDGARHRPALRHPKPARNA